MGAVQGNNRCDLDGLKYAIVQIAFQSCQGRYEIGIPHTESNPPSRHGVALGEAEQFYAYLFCSRDLKETGGLVTVENQVGISEVMYDDDLVFSTKFY